MNSRFLVLLSFCAIVRSQFYDPMLGPIHHPGMLGPPMHVMPIQPGYPLGPQPFLPPPYLGGPPLMGPPVMGPPMLGPPMLGPPMPYGGGFMAFDEVNDEQQQQQQQADSAQISRRSANTNVQSGIQQFGTGNMNLQGNIQQIARR